MTDKEAFRDFKATKLSALRGQPTGASLGRSYEPSFGAKAQPARHKLSEILGRVIGKAWLEGAGDQPPMSAQRLKPASDTHISDT